jgi:hypothetical protein
MKKFNDKYENLMADIAKSRLPFGSKNNEERDSVSSY